MATFQSEYETTTDTIDSVITTQLSSVLNWVNVPGGLSKVTSSSAGFAWGYTPDNKVWSCQLPCSGNWQSSDLTEFSIETVLDITSDSNTIYILFRDMSGNIKILMTDASRQGIWNTTDVPFSATSIFSTYTYLWAQGSNNVKQKCPKPCTTPNWIPSDENVVTITSSTDRFLYGKDNLGNAMQTDETMKTGWSPLQEFGDVKIQSIIGSDDKLYAIDEKSNTLVYDGETLNPLPTAGQNPMNITAGNNQLWMISTEPSTQGNVFTRIENPDYAALLNTVGPLDRKRDEIVRNVETKFKEQTDVMTVNKQADDIIGFFKNIFNIDADTAKKARSQWGHLSEQINYTQKEIDKIAQMEPIVTIAIGVLFVISLVYILIGKTMPIVAHIISIMLVGGGIFFILNFK